MLALSLWLLAQPAGAPAAPDVDERWVLTVELPRTVDVGGLGALPLRMRAVFLLQGPLANASAEPCSLEVESALARASATALAGSHEPLRLMEQAGVLRTDDARALLPARLVRFTLRIAGVGVSSMSAEVQGRLSLEGRRDGVRVAGEAVVHGPSDRVAGPAFVPLRFASDEPVRGRFFIFPSAAERCDELLLSTGAGGAP